MHKVFISHSSKDREIVKNLIDDILVGSLAVKISEIFCTTTDGTKIEAGEDWRNSIQEALRQSEITILIITPNYKESEVCMCEMGAAWLSSSKVITIIVDPINYSTVGIIQKPNQIEKLLDDKSLDRLRDLIQERLKIDPKEIRSDRWSTKKIEFLQKTIKYLAANPFLTPLSREEFDLAIKQRNNFEKAVNDLINEKIEREAFILDLKKLKDTVEIKKIERKYKKVESIAEFKALCKKISSKLTKLSLIVRGIVFVSYSEKNITISCQGWEAQISEAISKDYITDDLKADWRKTTLMGDLLDSLNNLSSFIKNKEKDEAFIETYNEQFEAPLSLSNMDFWEKAFNLRISIT